MAAVDWVGQDAWCLTDLRFSRISNLNIGPATPRTAIVPVVILTSSKEDRDRASGYYGGANSYVQKPADFTSFVDAVRQLGMYWLMLNEPPPSSRT